MFIFNFEYCVSFYKNINEADLSLSALVPYESDYYFIDYPLSVFHINVYSKFLYLSYILQIYTLSFNNKNYFNQYMYIRLFYKYLI